jgi:hypothetical protein
MHIDSASVGAPSVFEQLPGTDKIHMKISKIDTQIEIDGEIDAFKFIPLVAQSVKIGGMAVDLTLESQSSDNVHWKLVDSSAISYDSLEIKTSNSALNWIITHMMPSIKKLIL